MSRPLDPRLLRAAPSLRRYLAVTTLGQLIAGVLIVAQAALLALVLVEVFSHHDLGRALVTRLILLGFVGLGRAVVASAQEYRSARASVRVRAELRERTLRAVVTLGPLWTQRQPAGRVVNATGPGLDALDGFVTRALPALVAACAVPVIVLSWITVTDWQSGLILLVTLPLVPLFMALVGVSTKRRIQRQYLLLARMSGHFLDLIRGLSTLTIYGQGARQERTLRDATERYRRETMSALRIAFLSALVLDLVAALAVAVVAVDVGLRLDAGAISFTTALVVLLLAPELFAPLRALGVQYHASQEGAVAAAAALEVIDEAGAASAAPSAHLLSEGRDPEPLLGNGAVTLDRLSVRYEGREDAALEDALLAVRPREVVALVGRSGAGKTTMLSAILGLLPPTGGRVLVGAGSSVVDLATIDPERWRATLAWLPQRPAPTQSNVADEVRLGDPHADDDAVLDACRQCRTPPPVTSLGEDGRSVSAGQRRRIALARVLLRAQAAARAGAVAIVLLDEPSEDLDQVTEAVVAEVITRLAEHATIVMATHSERLIALADRRIVLDNGRITRDVRQHPARAAQQVASATDAPALAVPATDRGSHSLGTARPARLGLRQLVAGERLRGRLLAAAALSALAGLTGLALTGTSIWLISRAAQHPNVQALAIAVVGVRTFALGRSLLRYLERLTAHDLALRLLVGLRAQVFAALRPLGPAALGGYRRGDLLRRFVGDVDGLQDGLVRVFLPLTAAVATAAGACTVVGLLDPRAALILTGALLLAGVLAPFGAARAAGDGPELAQLAGRRDQLSSALVDGVAELVAYGAASRAVEQVVALDQAISRRIRRPAIAATMGTGLSMAAGAFALPAVLAAGAAAVRSGRMPGIGIGLLAICVVAAFEAVTGLPAAFTAWTRCRAGLARVAHVLAIAPAFTEPDESPVLPGDPVGLAMRQLQLRPAPTADPLLRLGDLSVAAGTRTALIGPSGSGKSSLLAAALRLLALDRGRIELTGPGATSDLRTLRAADVAPLVAGSLQGDHVFDATLRDNLRVVKPAASDKDLDDVARQAGLSTVLAALPLGWSTPAGPDGSALSGGQRQRLLLARALLADPRVLVLDEPTAHLDADTEREILADLLDATAGRTVLMSTHRALRRDQFDATWSIVDGIVNQVDQPIVAAGLTMTDERSPALA